MANPVTIPGLEDAIEYLPNRLWYVALKKAPPRINGAHFFSIDEELVYWNFYLDFGPLNLGHTFVFSDMLNKKLANAAKTGERIFFYSSAQGQQRANAACILACWAILCQGMSAAKAYEPFERMRFPPFHDATPSVCTFNLTVLDCLKGLERAVNVGYLSTKTFDLHEYQHFERVENGDLTWVSPKFIAFAGPHNTYSRTPQGHVMLTPEHYIPYFKKKNVTLVVRLNEKQYDERKFLSAGIDHLDLIYPDGTNAPMPVLLKFLEACEKTPGAVAVHCKAGLGRTGTCIGAYMMKHDQFTAHELIGWLRICRPGSVIGPQQQFMEVIEPKMLQLHAQLKASVASKELSRSASGSGNIAFSTSPDGKSAAMIMAMVGPSSPTRLSSTGGGSSLANSGSLVATGKLDKTQGDKLNDQKYMRYSRNKASVPSGSMFW
jgi:cell division cycle 14